MRLYHCVLKRGRICPLIRHVFVILVTAGRSSSMHNFIKFACKYSNSQGFEVKVGLGEEQK